MSVVTAAERALAWTNLQVEVGYFSGVEVVHPLQDLPDELSGLLLAQRLLLGQEVEQLAPRDPATRTHGRINVVTGTQRTTDLVLFL